MPKIRVQRAVRFVVAFAAIGVSLLVNAATAKVSEGFVKADDGAQLFYQKWGSGKQVVIIPARFLLGEDFTKLAKGRTLVMYDMRNRGRSSHITDAARISVQDDVRDLEAVRKFFKADKFSTVGYSYLGKMVMLYAITYPGRLERAVQMGPVSIQWGAEFPANEMNKDDHKIVDGAGWSELQKMRKEGYDKSHPREFCEKEWSVTRVRLVGNQANVAKLGGSRCEYENEWPTNLGPHFQASFTSIQKANISDSDLATITIPVLTIHGTKDRNAPYGSGKQWATRLPNARFISVDGAAHNSWVDEAKIIDWIDEFLGGNWPAPARDIRAAKPQNAT
jgi:pimeloyl-ACP methyl ester carboxylesterase